MTCKICQTRRPQRACPGAGGEICSPCCGTERENSIACPLDCAYLREARIHEKPPALDLENLPNADIPVTEDFLRENEELLMFLAGSVLAAGLDTEGAVDTDVRDALDALIRTYRTLNSGIYYETKPANFLAASMQRRIQESLDEFRRKQTEQLGMATVRDTGVLGMLVFLQRFELRHNNGRKRGRAFLNFLREYFVPPAGAPSASPLALP
ncbi:MAG: hypothetical protein ABSG25_02120 [Bryobacteraceae bacterium]